MEQVSGLYNPDFVGGQFHWWIGQVANSKSWRDNQPKKHFLFRNDIPGWGYRYKVRIMGIHDSGCGTIPSDTLPWAQVMYPITAGGGQGGDFESPGIKQGNFVFGFFLDGSNEQVPIIMGVLGNNAKTVIKNLNDGENCEFEPKSGYDTETTVAADDQLMTKDVASVATIESSDANNKDNAADENQKIEREKESPIECPKHGNTLTSMQTHMGNFQKDYQRLMDQLNSYGSAASVKTAVDTDEINSKIDQLVEKTSKLSAKSLTPSVNNTQNFLSQKLNDVTKTIDDATSIFDRLDNLEANVKAQGKLGCVFNKIKGDLARLIAAGIKNSLAKKQNRTPQNVNQTRPQGNNSGLIPPIPPEGFYTPTNPCETEDIIADVFSNVMGDITQGYQDAITTLAPGSGVPKERRLVDVLSQENVITNLENGKLFGGLAAALGSGLGINANQSGAITSALKSGNYAAALTSLVDFSGSSTAIGGLSTAIQSIDNGDIVGAFQGLSGPLGIDSKLMGAVGASLGAITNGDINTLDNCLRADQVTKTGYSYILCEALSYAAQLGQTRMVNKLLCSPRVNPDILDDQGNTPLIQAILYKNDQTAISLINHDNGTRLSATCSDGMTAIMHAIVNGSKRMVNYLLKIQSDSKNGCDPLNIKDACNSMVLEVLVGVIVTDKPLSLKVVELVS